VVFGGLERGRVESNVRKERPWPWEKRERAAQRIEESSRQRHDEVVRGEHAKCLRRSLLVRIYVRSVGGQLIASTPHPPYSNFCTRKIGPLTPLEYQSDEGAGCRGTGHGAPARDVPPHRRSPSDQQRRNDELRFGPFESRFSIPIPQPTYSGWESSTIQSEIINLLMVRAGETPWARKPYLRTPRAIGHRQTNRRNLAIPKNRKDHEEIFTRLQLCKPCDAIHTPKISYFRCQRLFLVTELGLEASLRGFGQSLVREKCRYSFISKNDPQGPLLHREIFVI
jgi:hypothetical protein